MQVFSYWVLPPLALAISVLVLGKFLMIESLDPCVGILADIQYLGNMYGYRRVAFSVCFLKAFEMRKTVLRISSWETIPKGPRTQIIGS